MRESLVPASEVEGAARSQWEVSGAGRGPGPGASREMEPQPSRRKTVQELRSGFFARVSYKGHGLAGTSVSAL